MKLFENCRGSPKYIIGEGVATLVEIFFLSIQTFLLFWLLFDPMFVIAGFVRRKLFIRGAMGGSGRSIITGANKLRVVKEKTRV